jgi:CRISPR-associated endonuclease/helicase Cas3
MAYAHSRENRPESEWEPLIDHLRQVELRAAGHAAAFQSAPWGALAGRWHDLGKYLPEFLARLRGSQERVDHAAPGAVLASELGGVGGRALAFAIAGHHAGLANAEARGEARQRPLTERLAAARAELPRVREAAPGELTAAERPPLPPFLERLPARTSTERERSFRRVELWTRFLFSALVDADRLETARFYGSDRHRGSGFDSISTLRQRLDRTLDGFAADTAVNRMRARVLADCRARAELAPGLFSLSVPTGGGKTLSGMAFALRHAELHELRRVVVAIPYTSIIEQNAAIYANVLGAGNVIEHHSAIDEQQAMEDDREREVRRRLAAENWDAPVIVTTNVQLFESLFSNEPSRCRKLHNLARSVIVLDEAQALPPEFLDSALDALRELVDVYGCTVVLCTATQPALTRRESLPMGFEERAVREIIAEPRELAQALERVTVHWPEPGVTTAYEDLAPEVAGHDRVLAIVHLRKDARTLAKLLPAEHRYHLSALMCAAHRSEVLAEVRRRLEDELPCRLVATQLIEAGVDVDFPVVFRALAGLDSVAQAAGRCNRNGRLERGDLFVFRAETSPPPGLLRIGLQSALGMLASRGDDLRITDARMMDEYFRSYYGKCSTDGNGVQPERARMNFANVADRMRLIEDEWSTPLVVPWGDAMERVRRHEQAPTRETARALQRFIVQVPRTAFEKGILSGVAVYKVGDSLLVLSSTHTHLYDPDFGLLLGDDR